MDTPPSSTPEPPKQLTRAQEQARLRRERRNAKIQAGGASRLEAITNLSGRKGPPPETTPQATKPSPAASPQPLNPPASATPPPTQPAAIPPALAASVADDPDVSDISSTTYTPRRTGTPQQQPPPPSFPFLPPSASSSGPGGLDPNDPTIQLMQQLLSGGAPGGGPGGADSLPPGLPPQLASFFSATQQAKAQDDAAEARASSSAYVWRVLHAVLAAGLGVWCVATSGFTGSQTSRTRAVAKPEPEVFGDLLDDNGNEAGPGIGEADVYVGEEMGRRLFLAFATMQVVLQTSRFFLERGRLQGAGWLVGLAGILPEPVAGWLRVAGRYAVIARTVTADAAVVIFVLGAASWWNGLAGG